MNKLGWRVYGAVRRQSDAEALQAEGVRPLIMDVADADSVAAAAAQVASEREGLDGLVNNAGIAVSGPLEYIQVQELSKQLEINVVGQVRTTQAFLPLLRSVSGRIVLMGSISGLTTYPFMGPYAASKHALEAIADSLRMELLPWGLSVSIIEPGTIRTPIWDKARDDAARQAETLPPEGLERYGAMLRAGHAATRRLLPIAPPPERVARTVERALTARRPRPRYLIGADARIQRALQRLLPTRLQHWQLMAGLQQAARSVKDQ
jgi:NAD(P)-dependent dehydrogenase (short-subunit alcohol dehydrogenase family)